MASWFGASNSNLDEQVEKATSSSLEDIALNLEISDIIRSKTVQPKEAMRSLKKRIGHKNPNVQLAALGLTDTCVKNGGSHFLVEIASREFMDNLVSLLRAPGAVNPEVRGKMLELIQLWASVFEGNPSLSYAGDVYRLLKGEGFDFPPPTRVSSTFIDSSAPPDWSDADVCMRCRTTFTFTNRKHHCRNCGSVFCGACSSKSIPLPHIGIVQPVRVCDGCHTKLTERKLPAKLQHPRAPPTNRVTATSTMQPRNPRVEQDDDEDLKKALQMSLDDMKGGGYVPHPQQYQQHQTQQRQTQYQQPTKAPDGTLVGSAPAPAAAADDEDEELKAAIAASLRDMEEQKAKATWSMPTASSSSAATGTPARIERPDHELSSAEAENISLFATLVDRLQTQPPGTILREPQIQELYESIGALRPKLARTFGETMSKYETLCDLHAKLGTVVRYYDRMLEERMSYTYGRHGLSGAIPQAGFQPLPPANNVYPSIPPVESFYGGGPPHPTATAAPVSPQSPAMGPTQPQYSNYYSQPPPFDSSKVDYVGAQQYQQYGGYNVPPTPQIHKETPQTPSAPPNIPPPSRPPLSGQASAIAEPGQRQQQQLSQSPSQPPPATSWQYPPSTLNTEAHSQYSYPPPPQEVHHAPPPQAAAYPQHVPPTQHGYASQSSTYSSAAEHRDYPTVPNHQPQQKAVVEESLIEF